MNEEENNQENLDTTTEEIDTATADADSVSNQDNTLDTQNNGVDLNPNRDKQFEGLAGPFLSVKPKMVQIWDEDRQKAYSVPFNADEDKIRYLQKIHEDKIDPKLFAGTSQLVETPKQFRDLFKLDDYIKQQSEGITEGGISGIAKAATAQSAALDLFNKDVTDIQKVNTDLIKTNLGELQNENKLLLEANKIGKENPVLAQNYLLGSANSILDKMKNDRMSKQKLDIKKQIEKDTIASETQQGKDSGLSWFFNSVTEAAKGNLGSFAANVASTASDITAGYFESSVENKTAKLAEYKRLLNEAKTEEEYNEAVSMIPDLEKEINDDKATASNIMDFANNQRIIGQVANKIFTRDTSKMGMGERVLYDVVAGSSTMATSFGVALATGSTAAAGALFGAMAGTDYFTKAREQGMSRGWAAYFGGLRGTVEGMLEKFGLEGVMGAWAKSSIVARATSGFLTEAAQEFTQELAGESLEKSTGINNTTWGHIFANSLYAGAIGGILGGVAGVAGGAGKDVINTWNNSKERQNKLQEFRSIAKDNIKTANPNLDETTINKASDIMARHMMENSEPAFGVFNKTMQNIAEQANGVDLDKLDFHEEAVKSAMEMYPELTRDDIENNLKGINDALVESEIDTLQKDYKEQLLKSGVDEEVAKASAYTFGRATADIAEKYKITPAQARKLHPLEIGAANYNNQATGTYNQPAYHGSPYEFEKFTTEKIGSGVGEQAYGWGLYFSKDKELANRYKNELSSVKGKDIKGYIVDNDFIDIKNLNKDESFALQILANPELDDTDRLRESGISQEELDRVYSYIKKYENKNVKEEYEGTLYKVDIPEDNEILTEEIEQNPEIKNKLINIFNNIDDEMYKEAFTAEGKQYLNKNKLIEKIKSNTFVGDEIYNILANLLDSKKNASIMLNENGIKGIRLRPTKRNPAQNFVIFSDEAIKILEKNEEKVFNQSAVDLTKTPEFKNWFGDSKVVDEKGEPLVVYHGTKKGGFDTFSKEMQGKTDSGEFGKGFYFTPDEQYAKTYTGYSHYTKEGQTPESQIYSTYLNIKNPYETYVGGSKINTEELKKQGYDGVKVWGKSFEISETDFNNNDDFEEELNSYRNNNYDVIISTVDGKKVASLSKVIEWVAFNPNQIKSVENTGSFSLESDNIFYQDTFETPDEARHAMDLVKRLYAGENNFTSREIQELNNMAEKYDYKSPKAKSLKTQILSRGGISPKAASEFNLRDNQTEREAKGFGKLIRKDGMGYEDLVKLLYDNNAITTRDLQESQEQVADIIDSIVTDRFKTNEQQEEDYYISQASEEADMLGVGEIKDFKNRIKALKPISEDVAAGEMANLKKDIMEKVTAPEPAIEGYADETLAAQEKDLFGDKEEKPSTPRGQIKLAKRGKSSIITLFENADASTIIHELGHWYKARIQELAKLGSPAAIRDYKVMCNSVGVYDDFVNKEWNVAQEERLARSFESYFAEDRMPANFSAPLKTIFDNMREWILKVYKSADRIGANITPEVREIFDRLFVGKKERISNAPSFINRAAMDQEYKDNIEIIEDNKGKSLIKDKTRTIGQDAMEWLQDSLVPIEDVINQMGAFGKELKNKLRKLFSAQMINESKYMRRIKGFIEGIDKLSDRDYATLDLALKNRDIEVIDEIVTRNGIKKEFEQAREVLDELHKQMIDTGADLGYLDVYFPRRLKDANKFLDYMEQEIKGTEMYSMFKNEIKAREADGIVLTTEDKAYLLNNLIRGYSAQTIGIKGISEKERKIKVVDAFMNQYYKNSTDALIEYVATATRMIEQKKFFGKESIETRLLRNRIRRRRSTLDYYVKMTDGEVKGREIRRLNYEVGGVESQIRNLKPDEYVKKAELEQRKQDLEAQVEYFKRTSANVVKQKVFERVNSEITELKKELDKNVTGVLDDSIGRTLLPYVENGTINHEQESRIKEQLLAIFNNKGLGNEFWKIFRDAGYISTLGNVGSAITQIADIAVSMYNNGFFRSIYSYGKAIFNKSEIKLDDVGVKNILSEVDRKDSSKLAKTLDGIYKITMFEKMDQMGKEGYLNASISKARSEAKKNDATLMEYLTNEFGDKAEQVRQDLADGKVTPEIIEHALFKLMDVQPLTIIQMPKYYAEGGKKRLFYMLKSYFIKQLNLYRQIIFEDMATNPIRAIGSFVKLSTYLLLANAGTDLLKDLLFGRKINVPDTLVNNIFLGGSINRYSISTIKQEGISGYVKDQLVPPVVMDQLIMDLFQENEIRDWKIWRQVPIVGDPYYWALGGGQLKKMMEAGKAPKKEKKEKSEDEGSRREKFEGKAKKDYKVRNRLKEAGF